MESLDYEVKALTSRSTKYLERYCKYSVLSFIALTERAKYFMSRIIIRPFEQLNSLDMDLLVIRTRLSIYLCRSHVNAIPFFTYPSEVKWRK